MTKTGNVKYGGAATIISRAKGPYRVDKRKGQPKVNMPDKYWYDPSKPEGSLIYTTAPDRELYYVEGKYNKKTGIKTLKTADGKTISYNMYDKKERDKYEPVFFKDNETGKVKYFNKDGSIEYKTKKRTIDSKQMTETDDAYSLVSKNRHPMELLYADYANSMKALANTARKNAILTPRLKYDPNASKIYSNEVASLKSKLNEAEKNSIKERTALRYANAEIKRKQEMDPDLKGGDLKKVKQQSVSKYRNEVGSISRKKRAIKITDKEWEAIQSGAISENTLNKILRNSDPDSLRERAMPKESKELSQAQISRIKMMNASNFSLAEIAEKMHISPSTVSKYLKGVK